MRTDVLLINIITRIFTFSFHFRVVNTSMKHAFIFILYLDHVHQGSATCGQMRPVKGNFLACEAFPCSKYLFMYILFTSKCLIQQNEFTYLETNLLIYYFDDLFSSNVKRVCASLSLCHTEAPPPPRTHRHTDTHTGTQTHTHRHTDTHTGTHTDIQRGTHTDTHRGTQTHTQTHRHTQAHRHTHRLTQRHTDIDRGTYRQTEAHTDRQHTQAHTDRQDTGTQTDRHTHRQTGTHTDRQTPTDKGTRTSNHTHRSNWYMNLVSNHSYMTMIKQIKQKLVCRCNKY